MRRRAFSHTLRVATSWAREFLWINWLSDIHLKFRFRPLDPTILVLNRKVLLELWANQARKWGRMLHSSPVSFYHLLTVISAKEAPSPTKWRVSSRFRGIKLAPTVNKFKACIECIKMGQEMGVSQVIRRISMLSWPLWIVRRRRGGNWMRIMAQCQRWKVTNQLKMIQPEYLFSPK